MAQEDQLLYPPARVPMRVASSGTVTVADGVSTPGTVTELLSMPLDGCQEILTVAVTNEDAEVDLAVFTVSYLVHPDDDIDTDAVTVASAEADFTTPVHPVVKASTNPVALAASASALLVLDVRGIYGVKIEAGGDSAETAASVKATAQ